MTKKETACEAHGYVGNCPFCEVTRLRAALSGLLQSLESDVHGLLDIKAAEARAALSDASSVPNRDGP